MVEQVFPHKANYRCHCPAVELMCTFPEGALVANWFVATLSGTQFNCNNYDNHQVEPKNGKLSLTMNTTTSQSLEGNVYSCTAVYSDGSTAESGAVTLPTIGGQLYCNYVSSNEGVVSVSFLCNPHRRICRFY